MCVFKGFIFTFKEFLILGDSYFYSNYNIRENEMGIKIKIKIWGVIDFYWEDWRNFMKEMVFEY